MANETLALAIKPPEAPDEDEFLTLCAVLSQSARGRAFLAEHARRSRNADNELLLTAIGRIEAQLKADASAAQHLRDDLRMLVSAIRLARPEIDAAGPAARATKLAKLLDLFERRIDAMAAAGAPAAEDIAGPRTAAVEPARAQLFVLPLPDEPEFQEPAIVVTEPAMAIAESEPPAAAATTVAPPADPLAALMALSADERLAVFT